MSTPSDHNLATGLMLVTLDPRTGRLPRSRPFGVALRFCLLAELVLDGRLASDRVRAQPVAERASGGSGDDRVLAAVERAVSARPGLAWSRWFTHVDADRRALTDDLVGSGRWTASGGLRATYVDTDAARSERLGRRVTALAERVESTSDPREAVVAAASLLTRPRSARPVGVVLTRTWPAAFAAALPDAAGTAATLSVMFAAAAGSAGGRRRSRPRTSLRSLSSGRRAGRRG